MNDEPPLHPTPQFARPGWQELGGAWQFAFDDDDRGLAEDWPATPQPFTRTIIVPFAPETAASGLRETGFHPVLWYRRAIDAAPRPGQRLWLHFGAVDYRARVWVNGRLVAEHEGGHTPFAADITPALHSDGRRQIIVVRAEDLPGDLAQPRGKQDWQPEPHAIWYHRTSGIWQPVWLEWKATTHIAALRWTPDVGRRALGLAVRLSSDPPRPCTLDVQLSLRGRPLLHDRLRLDTARAERLLYLPVDDLGDLWDELLWSPERPNLIDAVLTLSDGETTLDEVHSYAGLRSAAVGDGRFLLNGRPFFLRAVLQQGYWPESHLSPPAPAALRREVELIKELGFNAARIHQKVEDPRFLYWCDRLGLLIWGEMANAYLFNEEAAARLAREWLEVLQRDASHPCIVTWVPINESWGVPDLPGDPRQRAFVQALYHLTRSFDATRPVVDNDGWEHLQTDIITIHDYDAEGEMLRRRYGTAAGLAEILGGGRPLAHKTLLDGHQVDAGTAVMITEFGGISYAPQPGQRWFGYATVGSAEEYLAKVEELVSALLACPRVAGFCYTQLTDTEQETNGLLLETRAPKVDPERLRAIIRAPRRPAPGL